jgi:uncharacterized membrane protein YccC
MSFFVAAFFRPPLSDLPAMMAGIVVAYVLTAAVRLYVVRDDATAVVANARQSFRSLCAIALEQLPLVLRAHGDRMPGRVRRTFSSLRRATLELQEQLDAASNAAAAQTWRDAIVDEELAVVTAGEALLVLRAQGSPELERALVAALHAARASVRRPSHAHRHRLASMLRVVEHAGAAADPAPVRAFIASLQELAMHRDVAAVAQLGLTGTGVLPLQKVPKDEPGRLRFWTRVAIQAAIATGLAAIAGTRLSPARWYWAVIAAFVVFNRAATTGDAVVRAWQRTVGTAAGVVAGFAVVEIVRGHVRLEVALLFACIFAGFYAFRRSYLFLVVCFTALIAVFYSLLGRFTPGILLLRLEETTIGAAIAVLIAAAVLRTPTLDRAREALLRELHAMCAVLQALLRENPPAQLRERSREHDRALLDLLDAEELLAAPPMRARRHRAALPVDQVIRLGQRARLLTREALRGGDGARGPEARALSASADALLRSLTRDEGAAAAPSKPAHAR